MITLFKTDTIRLIALLERAAITIEKLSIKDRDRNTARMCRRIRTKLNKKRIFTTYCIS